MLSKKIGTAWSVVRGGASFIKWNCVIALICLTGGCAGKLTWDESRAARYQQVHVHHNYNSYSIRPDFGSEPDRFRDYRDSRNYNNYNRDDCRDGGQGHDHD